MRWLVMPRLHPIGQVFIWGRDGLGSECIAHSRLILLKTLFPLLNTKAALASCAFISCVNTLPSFLPQLQHLPAAEGKGEAAEDADGWAEGAQASSVEIGSQWSHISAPSSVKNAVLTTHELARPGRRMSLSVTAPRVGSPLHQNFAQSRKVPCCQWNSGDLYFFELLEC